MPPNRARETPENRRPLSALARCISLPADVLNLVKLIMKKINAVIVQMPLIAVPNVLNPEKNPESSDASGASPRDFIVPPGMVMVDAWAVIALKSGAVKAAIAFNESFFFMVLFPIRAACSGVSGGGDLLSKPENHTNRFQKKPITTAREPKTASAAPLKPIPFRATARIRSLSPAAPSFVIWNNRLRMAVMVHTPETTKAIVLYFVSTRLIAEPGSPAVTPSAPGRLSVIEPSEPRLASK